MTSHVVASCEDPNSRRKNGIAGITSVCMIANEMPATVSRESVIQCRRIIQKTERHHGVFHPPITRLEDVDPTHLKRSNWRSLAAFQRLFGGHAPNAELLEDDDFVASAVPGSNSSLVNAAVPIDGATIAPHLDEIARFFHPIPKWGVWIDPEATADAEALIHHGLVLDSTPVLMAAPLDAVERDEHRRVTRVSMDEVGVVNDAAYGIPPGTIGDALAGFPSRAVHPYGIREGREAVSVAVIQDVRGRRVRHLRRDAARLPRRAARVVRARPCAPRRQGARTEHNLTPGLQARAVDLRAPRLPAARRAPPLREAARVTLNPALQEAKYCPRCGEPANVAYPRSISCPHCGYGAYYNPKPVAAAIPVTRDDKIVLLRRGFDPGKGLWTFPGGFVDLGETVEAAARREAREEIEADDRTPRSCRRLLARRGADRAHRVRGHHGRRAADHGRSA